LEAAGDVLEAVAGVLEAVPGVLEAAGVFKLIVNESMTNVVNELGGVSVDLGLFTRVETLGRDILFMFFLFTELHVKLHGGFNLYTT